MLQPSFRAAIVSTFCALPALGLCAQNALIQEVPVTVPKLQIAVVSVRVGISRDVSGESKAEIIDQAIDQSKRVSRETLTITTEREKIQKITASAQAGMGSGGMSLSANAGASFEATDTQKTSKVRFTEKSVDDEKRRTETASSTRSDQFTKDSGYVEVDLEIDNPGVTLDASIRIGVNARDSSGGVIAIGSVYVRERDDGTLPDGDVTWLQVAPTTPDAPLRKSVRKKISTDQALQWLQQRLEFSADITNIVIKPIGQTTEFRPMDVRRRYELEGKAFVEIFRPGTASKSYLVDTRMGAVSLEDVLRSSANYEAGVTSTGVKYIASFGGVATKILPGSTLAEVLSKEAGDGSWFVLQGRSTALDAPLQAGDAISVMYLRRRDLLNGQSETKEFSSRLTLTCRSKQSVYALLSTVVTKDSLIELRIKGKRKLFESDSMPAKQRVTDEGTLSVLTDRESTRKPSQTLVEMDREVWRKSIFFFEVDDQDTRSMEELEQLRSVKARYTTDAREHVIVVKLPEDYFDGVQSRNLRILFAPEIGTMVVGRHQGFVNPGSRKFQGYNENKQQIARIAQWMGGRPIKTLQLSREHQLVIAAASSTPGANLTPTLLGKLGFDPLPLIAPDACPRGVLSKGYPGGCELPGRGPTGPSDTPDQLAMQVQTKDARPRIRDEEAEAYCGYDGR